MEKRKIFENEKFIAILDEDGDLKIISLENDKASRFIRKPSIQTSTRK